MKEQPGAWSTRTSSAANPETCPQFFANAYAAVYMDPNNCIAEYSCPMLVERLGWTRPMFCPSMMALFRFPQTDSGLAVVLTIISRRPLGRPIDLAQYWVLVPPPTVN